MFGPMGIAPKKKSLAEKGPEEYLICGDCKIQIEKSRYKMHVQQVHQKSALSRLIGGVTDPPNSIFEEVNMKYGSTMKQPTDSASSMQKNEQQIQKNITAKPEMAITSQVINTTQGSKRGGASKAMKAILGHGLTKFGLQELEKGDLFDVMHYPSDMSITGQDHRPTFGNRQRHSVGGNLSSQPMRNGLFSQNMFDADQSLYNQLPQYRAMARFQNEWDPLKDRRLTESKLFKESHLFINNVQQKRYLICKDWFNEWMSFLYQQNDSCPRSIDNTELASRIINEGYQNLRKNIDYFEFPQQTWKQLYSIYRGGPIILININGRVEIEPEMKPAQNQSTLMVMKHVKVVNQSFLSSKASDNGREEYEQDSFMIRVANGHSRQVEVTLNSGSIRPQDLQMTVASLQSKGKTKFVISSTLHDDSLETEEASITPGIGPLAMHQRVNQGQFNTKKQSTAQSSDGNRSFNSGGHRSRFGSRKGSDSSNGRMPVLSKQRQDLPPGLVGLDNQGNNCYMNATVQSILGLEQIVKSIDDLKQRMKSDKTPFTVSLLRITQHAVVAHTTFQQDQAKSASMNRRQVRKSYHANPHLTPIMLQKLVHQKFQPILQHDAHEFFIFLMTQVSDEIQKLNKKPSPRAQTDVNDSQINPSNLLQLQKKAKTLTELEDSSKRVESKEHDGDGSSQELENKNFDDLLLDDINVSLISIPEEPIVISARKKLTFQANSTVDGIEGISQSLQDNFLMQKSSFYTKNTIKQQFDQIKRDKTGATTASGKQYDGAPPFRLRTDDDMPRGLQDNNDREPNRGRQETQERWDQYQERNKSFVDHLFTGLYRSTVTCERCRLNSVTYDPFMVISVPVVGTAISECMEQFFAEEKLQNYFCIGCKQDSQNATLKVSIAHHPELLVIHLKRFQSFLGMPQSSSNNNSKGKGTTQVIQQQYMKKIRDFISYPLRLEMAPDVIYRLRSVVVHWGSLEHGHYVAVVGKNINTVPAQKSANTSVPPQKRKAETVQTSQNCESLSNVQPVDTNAKYSHTTLNTENNLHNKLQNIGRNRTATSHNDEASIPSIITQPQQLPPEQIPNNNATPKRVQHWYYCNDRNISECEEKVALSQEAYLLFYEKVKKPNRA
ncbi:hypothetical protein FGO68_gene7514 [Halteria grandinella]|uniref:Ubiquitinyl hydrolase 1 n=1 Tax=Halteria grandinella TaxID=5974 RepID=A0A8J8P1A0_HALGN|nr:hypothetical protein FGO68_gene7514 [Halteria grandinella]